MCGKGLGKTATYIISPESITVNMGEHAGDAKGSGSRGVATHPEIPRCPGVESAWP
jgi:hypothetical protein